jgi:hypothetical protein
MILESYSCELCLKQVEESNKHLFFRCSFAKTCWMQIGVVVPGWLRPERATRHLKRTLGVPFAMEIIMIMTWCIWKERNGSLFGNEDPSVGHCKLVFKKEHTLVINRAKESRANDMKQWLQSIG